MNCFILVLPSASFFLPLICVSVFLISCFSKKSDQLQSINVDEMEGLMRPYANLQIVDLRTTEDFISAHLPGAINIDRNSPTFDKEIAGLNAKEPVFFYCENGTNSALVAKDLAKRNFSKVYDIIGGYAAWTGANKKVLQVDRVARPEPVTRLEYNSIVKKSELVLFQFSPSSVDPAVLNKIDGMVASVVKPKAGEINFIKYNYQDQVSLARDLKVNNLPTLILYRSGEEVWRYEGMIEKTELESAIEKNLTKNYNSSF